MPSFKDKPVNMAVFPRRNRWPLISLVLWVLFTYFLYRTWFGGSVLGRNGERYAPIYKDALPKADPQMLPKLQHDFPKETAAEKEKREVRLKTVKEAFSHTWESYRDIAFGADELSPVSGKAVTSLGGWGATLVDSLDALWILGMKTEFEVAVLKAAEIDFNHTTVPMINVFETAIRYCGGFLGAYDVSDGKYPVLLKKAQEVGDLLYRAFDTPNRMPVVRWQVADEKLVGEKVASIAEVGSLTLEFTRLSQLTGDPKYYDAAYRVAVLMEEKQMSTKIPGLWPVILNSKTLDFGWHGFSLGGMADSAYEYLPKEHLMLGGTDLIYRRMYEKAIKAARKHLFYRPLLPDGDDILISGGADVVNGKIVYISQGQHLGCFLGGMVAQGAKLFNRAEEMGVARRLVNGCIWAYDSMPTDIMPEVFHMARCADAISCEWNEDQWHKAILAKHPKNTETEDMNDEDRAQYIISHHRLLEGYTEVNDPKYILRPEAIESVFVMYRMTGDKTLVEAAWRMFLAIHKHCRTELAYASIKDVTVEHVSKEDKMESFWLAETLKYFYLIFSDPEVISLDEFVL